MRSAPAARFEFPAQWAAGALATAVAALAFASVLAGSLGRFGPSDAQRWVATVATALTVMAIGLRRARQPASSLRWDRERWHLTMLPSGSEFAGELNVLIDIGPWMLFRFVPDVPSPTRWLGVRRGSLADRWQALRCTVYSPRPAATPDASLDEAAL